MMQAIAWEDVKCGLAKLNQLTYMPNRGFSDDDDEKLKMRRKLIEDFLVKMEDSELWKIG